ncbi:hypothetical protein ACFYOV_14050 [Streptomyces sp. NPDC005931]|uniref:hypothetical protein n=1 Tax=Streptomyces sp. NPDC005931 TaxID=3364737 RepID=UPI003680EA18
MSRETDTPSSGPNGRGGAAYPSGTPPYGIPVVPDDGTGAGRSATRPEERKTETTLTTRIRINIPGSRPIPPVVVRKPVTDTEGGKGDTEAPASASAASTVSTAPPTSRTPAMSPRPAGSSAEPDRSSGPAAQEPAEDKPASDWFAPRKGGGKPGAGTSGPGAGAPGGGSTNGAGQPGGSAGAAGGSGATGGPAAPGASAQGTSAGTRPGGGGRPGGVVGSVSVPGGPRPGSRPGGSGLTGATGGPVAPGHGGGTGSFDVTEALSAGSRPGAGSGEPRGGDGAGSADGTHGRAGQTGRTDPSGRPGHGAQGHPGGPRTTAGPTSGPATGEIVRTPPAGGGPGGPGALGARTAPGAQAGPGVPSGPGVQGGPGASAGFGEVGRPGASGGPGAPGAQGGPGIPAGFDEPGRPGGPAAPGGLSDDTAILTPQKPAPEPGGAPGHGPRHDNVSGHTVTSGIPVVPPGAAFGAGAPGTGVPGVGPLAHTPPRLPEPVSPPPAGSSKPPKKKGRNKLVLLGAGAFFLAGVAYGAGLLMNHSDVPKGTTVLGVDIGGGTRDEAVQKLDEALQERLNKPLKLSVGGRTVALQPDNAGLQFDTDATVGAAAKSDYNPVSVIGSLFGNHRVVEPVMPVDEEKLHAALEDAAGGTGSVTEGSITFESGRAVPVYPKAGQGIDVDKATDVVEEAYRTQVETGSSSPVTVATTTRQPKVSKAEVDRMMKEFAEPAMSANVTVQTDPSRRVPMSPQNSLWKFLRVEAVNGKLVDKPDLDALKELYGQAFEGVLITRGNGEKTPVTPQDVYVALRPALMSKTDRLAVIETDPS